MASIYARGSRHSLAMETAEIVKARRLPLSRVSNNGRSSTRNPIQKRLSRDVTANPQPTIERLDPFNFVPIAVGDPADVFDVSEYENHIYRTLRQEENKSHPLSFHQSEITLKERNLTIDAFDRFHYKLGLTTSTLYRFIGIFDRYLTVAQVPRQKLRLIAAACFFIASKIEDIMPVQSMDLIRLADNEFSQGELFATEINVINAIGFDTTFGTPLLYLTHFMRINGQTKETLLRARYILEICQTNEHFFGFLPSKMASIAVYVTRVLSGEREHWPSKLADFTKYSEADIGPAANWIRDMLVEQDRPETRFMRRKYGSDLFLYVAHISPIPSSFY